MSSQQRRSLAVAGAAAAGALGTTGYGLEGAGLDLRHPRLSQALVLLKNAGYTQEDWRRLPIEYFLTGFPEGSEGRVLLAAAIFCGTAQACLQGGFWAPAYNAPGAVRVDCSHNARPVSCLYRQTKLPVQGQLKPHGRREPFEVACEAHRSPLDIAARILTSSVRDRHVAVLRFTSARDRRNESIRYGHCTEDQIFLRTSYFQAFERMEGDLNAPIGESLDEGGLIYTSGVGLLRAAVRDGAPWFRDPPKVDVLWVALPSHPQRGENRLGLQDWYAVEDDSRAMAKTLDSVFAWAAARGVDALVLPPVGCDMHHCSHPPLGVASLIHETARRYQLYLPQVFVASDYPAHHESPAWWENFADVVRTGRQKPDPLVLVPPIQLPPHVLVKKDPRALLEKTRRATSRGRAHEAPRGTTSRGGPRRLPIC